MKIKLRAVIPAVCILLATVIWSVIYVTAGAAGTRRAQNDPVTEAQSEERFNILVAGCDRVTGLTDVMMLISVEQSGSDACILQIPRDTYAAYTEKSYKKLNGAYGALGGNGLCEFISESFGVDIHRYLVLSPDAFCYAVDAVGGVEIELDKTLYYNDPAQELYIHIPKGKHMIDGKLAEQLVRYRAGYASGDLGRIDVQKVVMCALMQKLRLGDTVKVTYELYEALHGRTDTDITTTDIGMLSEALRKLEDQDISFVTAPGEAVVGEKSGASYYVLSASAMSEIVEKYLKEKGEAFDPNKLFLNKNSKSFTKVYNEYSEYKVFSMTDIAKNGIGSVSY